MRLEGHSNDLWPWPLHVKYSILLVLSVESLESFALGEALGLEDLGGRWLNVVAGALELEGPPLEGVVRGYGTTL